MAQPAFASFPPPGNNLLVMRELKAHVDLLAEHLTKALENQELTLQAAFLRDMSQNVTALHKLTQSIRLDEFPANAQKNLHEILEILKNVLTMPLDMQTGTPAISIVDAVKNYSNPSTRESDLSIFFRSLEKYPEYFRILIQELYLISQDLQKQL